MLRYSGTGRSHRPGRRTRPLRAEILLVGDVVAVLLQRLAVHLPEDLRTRHVLRADRERALAASTMRLVAPLNPSGRNDQYEPDQHRPEGLPGNRTRALIIPVPFCWDPCITLPRRGRRPPGVGATSGTASSTLRSGTNAGTKTSDTVRCCSPASELEHDARAPPSRHAPANTCTLSWVDSPSMMKRPRPPQPVYAASVAVARPRDRSSRIPAHTSACRNRRLDTARELTARHAHAAAASRTSGPPRHADVGVGEHRRDRQATSTTNVGNDPMNEKNPDGSPSRDLHHEDQQRERRQRSSDVRDVDGDEAALPHVADQEADRQLISAATAMDTIEIWTCSSCGGSRRRSRSMRPVAEPVPYVSEEIHA